MSRGRTLTICLLAGLSIVSRNLAGQDVVSEDSSRPELQGLTNRPTLDEKLLFLPVPLPRDHRPANPPGVEDVWLTSADGVRLHGWWWPHPQPIAYVLYLHGNAGNLWATVRYLKWLHDEADCAVLAVDYRGYGLSEGQPTIAGVLRDIRAARSELCRRGVCPLGGDVLIGRSLGGALAIDLAAEVAPRGLVLESTFLSYREVARYHAGRLAQLVPDGRLDSQTHLSKYAGPLLQVHGDADWVVPFEQGLALHQVAPGPKHFVRVAGAGHFPSMDPDYLAELQRFLRELPAPPATDKKSPNR